MTASRPFVIELDAPPPDPGQAPPVPEGPVLGALPVGQPVRSGRWSALALAAAGLLVVLMAGVGAWDFTRDLLARAPWLGGPAAVLLAVVVVALVVMALREWLAWRRLGRIEGLRAAAAAVDDLAGARAQVAALDRLYARRPDLAWARARLAERLPEVLDHDAVLHLAEAELLAPLDQAARAEVEAAARRVAAITALVPLALVDVVAVLAVNLRMIRRIAELYGGRAGSLGSWRILRRVLAHLVATGLVALGDDTVSSLVGGSMVAKLSKRVGEGIVNGALTARVGVAAMAVCRPLPFAAVPAPRVSALLGQALRGLFPTGA